MKTIIQFASVVVITTFMFSCGNKAPKQETAAEEIVLSLTMANDPCYGDEDDILHIQGGKPFEDESNPYKVEAKNTEQGSIEFGTFSKNEDDSYQINIPSTTNLFDGEVTIEVQVTDANGTIKTIDFIIPHCI